MKTLSDVDKFCENYAKNKNKLLHIHLYQTNNQNDMKVVHEPGHQDISCNHTSGYKQSDRGTVTETVVEAENGKGSKTNKHVHKGNGENLKADPVTTKNVTLSGLTSCNIQYA